ncbi:MAG: type II toxin-antitoxin system RelE/ParE family toxin [Methylococcales bacterium]|nr:type II toxin-antitoxin system RelE/ParE family toxin [Methylococcales bacterium]
MAKSYKVVWANVAKQDLVEIIQYIKMDSPVAAAGCLKKIKAKVADLNAFPQRGRIVPELQAQGLVQYHELVISPWRVIYRYSENSVYVLSVIDGRRNVEDVLLNRLVRNKND